MTTDFQNRRVIKIKTLTSWPRGRAVLYSHCARIFCEATMRHLAVCVFITVVSAATLTGNRLSRIEFGGTTIAIEQEFTDAEEGSVLWDASRSLLAHVTYLREQAGDADVSEEAIAGKRILEIGSGTGAVGLALARLGAKSVVMTDKASQLPLMRRNLEHNQPDCCADRCVLCNDIVAPVSCAELCWSPSWQAECDPSLAAADAFDTIICADCVYPDRPSGLATVLLDLLALNPHASLLLAFEQRPPPAGAPAGTDHTRDFFAEMRAGCEVERVPDRQLDPRWVCDEISLWRMCARDESS